MKKVFSIIAVALLMTTAFMATGCKESPKVLWNVQAQANGEGKITITYPTGNPGLVVDGNASATATTTNDTTARVFGVPNGALTVENVLAAPASYSKQQVKDAEVLSSYVYNAVTFKAEGTWDASVTGYAKYGEIYFVIDEHWPADTTKVKVAE